MWNYYKTVVINSATAEDGHPMFFESEVFSPEKKDRVKAASVWRNGQYDLDKISGVIYKTVGYPGENAVLEINCEGIIPTQTLVEGGNPEPEFGLYQLSFNVEMDGKFLSDWATPNYKNFYKPIVVGLDLHTEDAEELAAYIVEQINLALPENNKFIKVEAKGGKVIITATDNYMILKPENVKFERYEVVGCDTCLGEYVPKNIAVVYAKNDKGEEMKGKQPFATGTWLLENQRLPNSNNFRYFGFNDEMPIAGAIYVQYSFDYVSDRPGLGGHSGVGQGITAITNHTFFVEKNAAPEFEKVFAGKTFKNTAE
jgi:hypothetical protein